MIVDATSSPQLNLTSLEMDTTRDEFTVSGIAPGSTMIFLTFSSGGGSACLSEDVYRKIFYNAILCTGAPVPGQVLGSAGTSQPACVEDPYGIIGAQTCEGTLQAVIVRTQAFPITGFLRWSLRIHGLLCLCIQSFGSSCDTPMSDLTLFFSLFSITVPGELTSHTFSDVCPVACDACGSAPGAGTAVEATGTISQPDCVEDPYGIIGSQTCAGTLQAVTVRTQAIQPQLSAVVSQNRPVAGVFSHLATAVNRRWPTCPNS